MSNLTSKIKFLPPKPGIYFFKNAEGEIIYIGKSINLKNRVKSYWQNRDTGQYIQKMVDEIAELDWKICASEFEALLLEAKLISQYQPIYNVRGRDDKRFLMIVVSVEDCPKIGTVRNKEDKGIFFGPFPSATEVRRVLKTIRQIFPFRSCKRLPKKACLYYHLKLCPGCCLGYPQKEYKKTIKKIIRFLNGDTKGLLRQLEKEMKANSKNLDFEKAAERKKQIEAINYVVLNWQSLSESELKIGLEKDDQEKILQEARKIFPQLKTLSRVEAYDISNLYGKHSSGSMIVFEKLMPAKDQYRRFKIKTSGIDDAAMIEEIIQRRLRHQKWQHPDLMIIDGGKGQVGSAFEALRSYKLEDRIFLLGLAKPAQGWSASGRKEEKIFKPIIKGKFIVSWKEIKLPKDSQLLKRLQHLRNESHRFAKKYHLWLRKKG